MMAMVAVLAFAFVSGPGPFGFEPDDNAEEADGKQKEEQEKRQPLKGGILGGRLNPAAHSSPAVSPLSVAVFMFNRCMR
jgi:hypothetical protein